MKFASHKIRYVSVEDVKPNPFQCRRNFNHLKLKTLAESIKKHGILIPLILRATKHGFEVVCGSRRYRAALIAGINELPAVIISAGDKQCAQINLIENIHRDNLTVFEEGEAYFNLFSYHGIKKDKMAGEIGVDTTEINEKIKFLKLEPSLRYKIEENKLSKETVRELLKIHDSEKQKEAADAIMENALNENEAASLVKETNRKILSRSPDVQNLTLCRNTINKTVDLLKENGNTVEVLEREEENRLEFTIKIRKTGVF